MEENQNYFVFFFEMGILFLSPFFALGLEKLSFDEDLPR